MNFGKRSSSIQGYLGLGFMDHAFVLIHLQGKGPIALIYDR